MKPVLILLVLLGAPIHHSATNASPFPIENYQNPNDMVAWSSVANLSGITHNWVADEYVTVHQNQYCRFDAQLNELGCGSLACGDCEDISFLGTNGEFYEYALVEEGGAEGSVAIVQSPISTHNLRLDQVDVQWLTYANTAGGDAGEGVAYDALNQIFYVCIEDPQMQVLSFQRPTDSSDATFSDGSLVVTEALSFAQLSGLLGGGADLSSCYYDQLTGRLLLLSHIGHKLSDIDLSGVLHGQIELPQAQVEGFTFNADFTQLLVVAEPNLRQIYYASDVIFSDGFESVFVSNNEIIRTLW
ncbi:SdiA-regulated domain-containing protein [Marinicella litoralis]|uniref:SdiA-regulated protein n=1 Tax=Marinicella litoralis TaxID=644220 RepID=A0A4R6XLJ4_9GAMM|nr:SdiA-regulated domain-containing protein [Marinicella litoralis]TDR20492.1 SdiA-regulated protein [Marinicella litoralis]